MLYIHKLSFDLKEHKSRQRIPVAYGSGETIAVELSIFDGTEPWNIPEGTACVIRYMKANGNGGVYHVMEDGSSAWSVEENRATILLIRNAVDIPGLVNVSVALVNNGRTLCIHGFDVHVDSNLLMPLDSTDDLLEFQNLSEINTAFAAMQLKTDVDPSLSIRNKPADAAAVGAALAGKAPASGFMSINAVDSVEDLNALIETLVANQPVGTEKTYYCTLSWYANAPLPTGRWSITIHKPDVYSEPTWAGVTATVMASQRIHHLQRELYSGTWLDWEWENPNMELGKEYRTTERWKNKAVYTKLVEVGALPASGSKSFPLGIFPSYILSHNLSAEKDGFYYSHLTDIKSYVSSYGGEANLNVSNTTDLSAYKGTVKVKYTKD